MHIQPGITPVDLFIRERDASRFGERLPRDTFLTPARRRKLQRIAAILRS